MSVRRALARLVCLALVVVAGASLSAELAFVLSGEAGSNSGPETVALPVAVRVFRMFSFFTVQSNLLALVAAVTLLLRPDRDGRAWRVLRLDALLGLSITGLVYWTVLAPSQEPGVVYTPTNIGLHLLAPVLTVGGWLVFGPRPRIAWSTLGWALVWPVAWIAFTFGRGAVTGWYPYPFIDASQVGYPSALAASGGIVLLGLVLAVVYKLLDRLPPQTRG